MHLLRLCCKSVQCFQKTVSFKGQLRIASCCITTGKCFSWRLCSLIHGSHWTLFLFIYVSHTISINIDIRWGNDRLFFVGWTELMYKIYPLIKPRHDSLVTYEFYPHLVDPPTPSIRPRWYLPWCITVPSGGLRLGLWHHFLSHTQALVGNCTTMTSCNRFSMRWDHFWPATEPVELGWQRNARWSLQQGWFHSQSNLTQLKYLFLVKPFLHLNCYIYKTCMSQTQWLKGISTLILR